MDQGGFPALAGDGHDHDRVDVAAVRVAFPDHVRDVPLPRQPPAAGQVRDERAGGPVTRVRSPAASPAAGPAPASAAMKSARAWVRGSSARGDRRERTFVGVIELPHQAGQRDSIVRFRGRRPQQPLQLVDLIRERPQRATPAAGSAASASRAAATSASRPRRTRPREGRGPIASNRDRIASTFERMFDRFRWTTPVPPEHTRQAWLPGSGGVRQKLRGDRADPDDFFFARIFFRANFFARDFYSPPTRLTPIRAFVPYMGAVWS